MVLLHLFFPFCIAIQPKIGVFIDMCFLFVHDHATKIYDDSIRLEEVANNFWNFYKYLLKISASIFKNVLILLPHLYIRVTCVFRVAYKMDLELVVFIAQIHVVSIKV